MNEIKKKKKRKNLLEYYIFLIDCTPEHICFSKNENFIIIADSMGRIHFFHLNTKNIVFSQQLIQPNNTIDNQPCFLSLCFNTKK